MLDTRLRRAVDWPLIAVTYLLATIGVLIIFSTTRDDPTAFYKKQIINIILGSFVMIGLSQVDYHIFGRFSRHIYVANLCLLALVFVPGLGHTTNGAGRWIHLGSFPLQPSEIAKLLVIITLAFFLAEHHETIHKPRTLLLSFLYISVPIALIFRQPDLGTALVVMAIWFGMVFMAGAKPSHLLLIVVVGSIGFACLWHSGKIKDYQKKRLEMFFNQSSDPKKAGYHVWQARIAIGSGGMWGKGLLHSTQVRGGYIPEKQTDFIFTDVGEEFGFVGAVLVTVLYGILLWRGATITAVSDEDFAGKLIASGIMTMIGFHVIVNIGMNIGIMPVAGVPLLLISYGGSNMLLTLASIGVLQSVSRFRHQLLFNSA